MTALRGSLTAITLREGEVLDLMMTDLSNGEIAERLVVSIKTVEAHLGHAREKAGRHTRVGLALWWMAHGRAQGRLRQVEAESLREEACQLREVADELDARAETMKVLL